MFVPPHPRSEVENPSNDGQSGSINIGDSVVVFAQGPIGLCATAGAKLRGATRIIVVDGACGVSAGCVSYAGFSRGIRNATLRELSHQRPARLMAYSEEDTPPAKAIQAQACSFGTT